MSEPAVRMLDDDAVVLRRTGVRFPIELRPAGFQPEEPRTWPEVEGRLEWVEGRLLYMPPCADTQQEVAVDVVFVLRTWSEKHPEFVVGGNEAGMKLGNDIRAADAAVWRGAETGPAVGRLRHVPPVLVVEVVGQDEDEAALREKARWYLQHGVQIVWLVLPEPRQVVVLHSNAESRHSSGEKLPPEEQLPGLTVNVDQFFVQINRR